MYLNSVIISSSDTFFRILLELIKHSANNSMYKFNWDRLSFKDFCKVTKSTPFGKLQDTSVRGGVVTDRQIFIWTIWRQWNQPCRRGRGSGGRRRRWWPWQRSDTDYIGFTVVSCLPSSSDRSHVPPVCRHYDTNQGQPLNIMHGGWLAMEYWTKIKISSSLNYWNINCFGLENYISYIYYFPFILKGWARRQCWLWCLNPATMPAAVSMELWWPDHWDISLFSEWYLPPV